MMENAPGYSNTFLRLVEGATIACFLTELEDAI